MIEYSIDSSPKPVRVDGGGAAFCDRCNGSLMFSWVVVYSTGYVEALCSKCVPEVSE